MILLRDGDMQVNPLVSIIVFTYNSSKYVLETLESIRNQSYKNLELIITDDCSTDNTIDICSDWVRENNYRFSRVVILSESINSGIPSNCNRGIKNSCGDWIKLIAGDDVLNKFFIEKCINHINANEKIELLFTNYFLLKEEDNTFRIEYPKPMSKRLVNFFNLDSNKQYLRLIKGDIEIIAASNFYKKQTILDLGYFEEKYLYCEDYPFYLKATLNNVGLHYFHDAIVGYRITNKSISNSSNVEFDKTMLKIFLELRFWPLFSINPLYSLDQLFWSYLRLFPKLKKIYLFSPFFWWRKFKTLRY